MLIRFQLLPYIPINNICQYNQLICEIVYNGNELNF